MPDRLYNEKTRRDDRARPRSSDAQTVTAASSDGVVTFRLSPCPDGILVMRTQARARGGRLVQSIHFTDGASFIRWCDADRLKFTYPLVYANLRRSGCALFGT